ncbi:right-handed parallel beta-helix repeat-containing protein [Pararhizobium sp. PWRC1-1]|uniref:right-handed parallel beta-helix repeat-containing protein n=1 Tax=Pararhizobium sp. PWRC1-1 TaxID=2804566 RepID=UPI003CF7DBA6
MGNDGCPTAYETGGANVDEIAVRIAVTRHWLALCWVLALVDGEATPSAFAQAMLPAVPASAGKILDTAYPNETNTGVPAGLNLTPATTFTLDVAGATVSGLDFRGTVAITAANVKLMNCRITGSGWAALDIRADGVTVENCEIDGQRAPGIRGISVSGNNVKIRHSNIHSSEDGIYLTGSSKIYIENNYIHDLQSQWESPHFDGIATDGGISDVLIRGNTVINPHAQTSAIMLSNYSGSVSDVRIEENWLIGGGYTIYADDQFDGGTMSNISMTDNRLGRGYYGYAVIGNSSPVFSRNTDDQSGTAVER